MLTAQGLGFTSTPVGSDGCATSQDGCGGVA